MIGICSGAGGLDLGLERAGFTTLAAVDIDKDCVETLRANRGALRKPDAQVLCEDLGAIKPKAWLSELGLRRGELDLLAGGPPCQAFTTTGRRRALADDRGSVVHQYLRLLRELEPAYFLMENVTGFLSVALRHRPLAKRGKGHRALAPDETKGSVFRWFLSELVDSGYTVTWGVLDAVDFGVPQFRQRTVLVGTRSAHPVYLPRATHFESGKPRWLTLMDAVKGLNETGRLVQPLSEFKVSVFRNIPAGGNWRDLTLSKRRATMGKAFLAEGGKSGWWRRLAWEKPTPTILTMPDHSSTGLIHPEETRCLSVRECARCQTFPDEWQFKGSSRSQYRQIGNAVPVALAASLGRHILMHMDGVRETPPAPPVWRKASANQRLGTWGWVVNSTKRATVLNRRDDHVDISCGTRLKLAAG
jgi:DNA (cytosine-5)-methyltransferase 1